MRQPLSESVTNEYEAFLNEVVPQEMPYVYVEGYRAFRERALARFPRRPDLVFTANSFTNYDDFKLGVAERIEEGVPLVGTQHGGVYGQVRFSHDEEHQLKICDRYYTWGWTRGNDPHVVPFVSTSLSRWVNRLRPDPDGDILWVSISLPRWAYNIAGIPIGPQILRYFSDQVDFFHAAAPAVRALLLLRLYPHDYGWDFAERWRASLPALRITAPTKRIHDQLCRMRMCICTNSTTYLETFTANYPTVLYWNREHSENLPEAEPYFDGLRKAGILHHTAEGAAAQVNAIHADPLAWWRRPEVQEAKNLFAKRFCRAHPDFLRLWRDELRRSSRELRRVAE